MLQAIAGYDQRDPTTVDVPVPEYTQAWKVRTSQLRLGIPRSLQQNSQWNSPAPYDCRENPRRRQCGLGDKDDWPARSAPGCLGLHRMASTALCRCPDGRHRGDEYVGDFFGRRVFDLGHRNGDFEPWLSSVGLELGALFAELVRPAQIDQRSQAFCHVPQAAKRSCPRNSQKDGEGVFHVLLKTKIRTNGVKRNSSVERRPADSQHRRQLVGE